MGDLFEVYPSREASKGLRYRLGGRPSSYQAAVVDAKVDEVLLVNNYKPDHADNCKVNLIIVC